MQYFHEWKEMDVVRRILDSPTKKTKLPTLVI